MSAESQRVIELQELLTHQQQLFEQLSEVVAQQSADVQQFRRELDAFKQYIKRLTADLEADRGATHEQRGIDDEM